MAAVPSLHSPYPRIASLASSSASCTAQFSGSRTARQLLRIPAQWDSRNSTLPLESRVGGSVRCMAKGGKKGGNKKGGPSIPKHGKGEGEGDPPSPPPSATPYTSAEIIMHSLDLIDSYFRVVGSTMFSEPVEVVHAAKALWDADFAMVSHGTEGEPILNYGNARALELFEASWAEFTAMPSSNTCPEGTQRESRSGLLQSAQAEARDLKGIVWQTTKGRLFEVEEGVLWTLVANDGENFGQAAVLRQWHFLDEKDKEEQGKEGSEEGSDAAAADVPTAEPAAAGPLASPEIEAEAASTAA